LATRENTALTMIFDEVDSGLGGAVAAAMADRLARLAKTVQVLVVTHAPQIAAAADHHWVVRKSTTKGTTTTSVDVLTTMNDRQEEIARMLSGKDISTEARAAAKKLLHTVAA
jgi:DNA repair protein RecN (Recombination protein N)